jgi:gliding motility-associated protein GldL
MIQNLIDKLTDKNSSVKIPFRARLFNFGYGIGASIVILGALFKLMYWKGANEMLMIGMITEAIIFALSAFERPFKTYEWDRIFNFDTGKPGEVGSGNNSGFIAGSQGIVTQQSDISIHNNQTDVTQPAINQTVMAGQVPTGFTSVSSVEGLSDDDAQKLRDSILQLAHTAQQLQEIAAFSLETEKFTQSIRTISDNTARYAENQESLISATQNLQQIYERIGTDTEKIEQNTVAYKDKVEKINNNLSGINSIYEIQLKDIHSQSVHFHNQAEATKKMSDEMIRVTGEISKLGSISDDFTLATEKLKTNAGELADNIARLNQIYGNMLNAMS